jgi:plastocyanin
VSKPSSATGTSLSSTLWFCGTALFLVGALLLVGLWDKHTSGSAGAPAPAGKNAVNVVETDFHIAMSQTVLPANTRITFVVHNTGPSPHELIIVKAPSSGSNLPLKPDADVNEATPGLTSALDSGSSLGPGETRTLTADMPAGHYIAVCNLPGHYKLGMRVDLLVN